MNSLHVSYDFMCKLVNYIGSWTNYKEADDKVRLETHGLSFSYFWKDVFVQTGEL